MKAEEATFILGGGGGGGGRSGVVDGTGVHIEVWYIWSSKDGREEYTLTFPHGKLMMLNYKYLFLGMHSCC